MKPGDLARLFDVGVLSGEIVLVLQVRPIVPNSDVMVVDFLFRGELLEEFHIDFFEPVQDDSIVV
jgi:hypothetical protein